MLNELLHEATPVLLNQDDLNSMKNSIENIGLNIDAALIDGKDKIVNVDFYQQTVVRGDDKCKVIALSSIIAKFIRDFIIRKYDKIFSTKCNTFLHISTHIHSL